MLAGGTGGAKLARGMLDVVGSERLGVIANIGDDVEVYGVHVSPDPDLVTWWLADVIDERGWGIAGDSWNEMERLAAAGESTWFRLGDRDLELCHLRTEHLRRGARLTEAHAAVVHAVGVDARVLPMCDEPVRTQVTAGGETFPFQEFMIVRRAEGPVEGVTLKGLETARPTPEVLELLASAEAVVIGPSNPVISIGPILAVPGMRDAIARSPGPVVAVSPFVDGRAVKGPTDAFCEFAGIARGAAGIAETYADVVDGVVADEPAPAASVPVHVTDTLLDTPEARADVARQTLDFAASLRD